MKFIFYDSIHRSWDEKISELKKEFPDSEFLTDAGCNENDIKEAHAFVGIMPDDHFRMADNLKMIFVSFTGPNMLPFEEMKKRGIRLSNTHGNARFVAEKALAMCLTLLGRIMEYHFDLKNKKWHGIWGGQGLNDTWDTLHDKNCAVIGTGEIGKWIAKYLKVFNCHVTGFKKKPFNGSIENFDRITLNISEAVDQSEIIFVTLPLTKDTEGLISRELLLGMKEKIIVNVGRGQVIDEEGLYLALKNKILKGACIDVWYTYPEMGKAKGHPSRFPIHELDNVIMSPHVGGYIEKASLINIDQTAENIRSYLRTGKPVFEIDLDMMY